MKNVKETAVMLVFTMVLAGNAYAAGAAVDDLKAGVMGSEAEISAANVPQPQAVSARLDAKEFAVWQMQQKEIPSAAGYAKVNSYSGDGLPTVKVIKHYDTSGTFLEHIAGKDEVYVGSDKVQISMSQDFKLRSAKSASVDLQVTGSGDRLFAVMNGNKAFLTYKGKDLVVESAAGTTIVTDKSTGMGGSSGPMALSGSNADVNITIVAYMLTFELNFLQ